MPIKFEVDRADNGNKFLCRDCVHAQIRSGKSTEEEIFCSFERPITRVVFEVTKCSSYQGPDLMAQFKTEGEKFYRETAYYYVNAVNQEKQEREFRFVGFDEYNYIRMMGSFKPKAVKPVKKRKKRVSKSSTTVA